MPLDTNFNVAPINDDFSNDKKFYRILFLPATTVQARELTQVQTILQDQIEKFGNAIYKNGSIVNGASITDIGPLPFVRLQDTSSANVLFNSLSLVGTEVKSNTSGLTARVVSAGAGLAANFPNTNIVYLQYDNSGSNNESVFSSNETLTFYQLPLTGNVSVDTVMSVNSFTSNTTANTVGSARAVHVSDGIIYQKGFFLNLDDQIGIVSPFTTDVGNTYVGFVTNESIITPDQDASLNDNSLGYGNDGAPGAYRLKLVPALTFLTPAQLASQNSFNAVAQYNSNNLIVAKTSLDNFSVIGDEMARIVAEGAGNYVVSPFTMDTIQNTSNSQLFTARVSPGVGYADGYRVTLDKQAQVDLRRGVDKAFASAQQITMNYGNYFLVREFAANFVFDNFQTVNLYSAPQYAISSHNYATLTPSGNIIGTAQLCGLTIDSNQPLNPGSNVYPYRLYVTNIVMSPGFNVTSIRSVGSSAGYCDIILDGNNYAVLQKSGSSRLLWSFGTPAIAGLTSNTGSRNTQFYARKHANSTIQTNGTISLNITSSGAGGVDVFPFGNGLVPDAFSSSFVVSAATSGQSANLSGTVTVGAGQINVVGSSSTFLTDFSQGDSLKIGSDVRRITSVTNSTFVTIDSPLSSAVAANTYVKFIPAGSVIGLTSSLSGNRSVIVNSSTSATIATGYTLTAPINVSIGFDVLRTGAKPALKVINKKRYVALNLANNVGGFTGPWCLGMSDVARVTAVYASNSTYSITNPNILSSMKWGRGQTDSLYGLGTLSPTAGLNLTSTPQLLVELEYYSANTINGQGFYSVESYPVNDSVANSTTITTAHIPLYVASDGTPINLRDYVDFRPTAVCTAVDTGPIANTANAAQVSTAAAGATVNPSSNITFPSQPSGYYLPSPDRNFQSDISYYLARQDLIYFNSLNQIKIKEGVSSKDPVAPAAPVDGMTIAIVNIQAFPSLSSDQVQELININAGSTSLARDTSSVTTVRIKTNKRYSMADIGVLDQRLTRLEYYQSLSLLETAAVNLQVTDANGNNRFKNGIFVDGFTDNTLGQVSNQEYRIAIDVVDTVARPYFDQASVQMQYMNAGSVNIQQSGRCLTLPYTEIVFMSQPFATKVRQAAPAAFKWNGKLSLYPCYDNGEDYINRPAVSVTLDNASVWSQFANSPFGTNWGSWNTTLSSSSSVVSN